MPQVVSTETKWISIHAAALGSLSDEDRRDWLVLDVVQARGDDVDLAREQQDGVALRYEDALLTALIEHRLTIAELDDCLATT